MQDLSLLVTLTNATLSQINATNGVANIQLANGKINNITLSNPTPGTYTLNLQQDVKGYCVANFVTPITWNNNIAPMLSTQPGFVDVIQLVYDGTSWVGYVKNYVPRTETMMVFRTTTANEVVTLPYEAAGTYAGTIFWGDTSSIANSYANRTHTYAVAGEYLVVVNGGVSGFTFNNAGDKTKILSVLNWGTAFRLGNTGGYFYGCTNLTLDTVADVLNLTGTTTFVNAFNGCTSLVKVNRMNEWDTSLITSFASLFVNCVKFNQYINNWNTASVTDMSSTFQNTYAFNQPLGAWNTSNVTTMAAMFSRATAAIDVFNQDLSSWDVSKVTTMFQLFNRCGRFNSPLNTWNTASVTTMSSTLYLCYSFNQPLSNWNTANVTDMSFMFYSCILFNQNINTWNTAKVTNMQYMLGLLPSFNQPLNNWDVSKVTNFGRMFVLSYSFNQDLSSWNTSLATSMISMFYGASISNTPIHGTSYSGEMSFNGNISSWNTANVTNMSSMFRLCVNFNQDISAWNTVKVTDMNTMFWKARSFNQPIGSWNVTNVTNMSYMFEGAVSFNQNLSAWSIAKVTNFTNFMTLPNPLPGDTYIRKMSMSPANVSAMYNGWAALTPTVNVAFQADVSIQYDATGVAGRAILTNNTNKWSITDGGCAYTDAFISTWATTAAAETVTLPYEAAGTYSGTIYWGDGSSSANSYANRTHTYTDAGTYTIVVDGVVNGFTFNNAGDKTKLYSIQQWGTRFRLGNTGGYFYGCTNLTLDKVGDVLDLTGTTTLINAFRSCSVLTTVNNLNNWNVSAVTSLENAFLNCFNFNQSLNNWNTANVTTLTAAFGVCSVFNQPLNNWDTSNVTTMQSMFSGCSSFNQPLNNWNTGLVTNMSFVFNSCSRFNQNINSWNTSKVTNMQAMFQLCSSFNQPLNNWNTSNVTIMQSMFIGCTKFNQPLSNWNLASCTNISKMFQLCTAFNQSLSSWNTSKVTTMAAMFTGCVNFNQDISTWDVSKVTDFQSVAGYEFMGAYNSVNYTYSFSTANLDKIYIYWSKQSVVASKAITFYGIKYSSAGVSGRAILTNAPNSWTITDGGLIS